VTRAEPPGAPPELFDSHCHLQAPTFRADWQAVWQRARESGVGWALVVATSAEDAASGQAVVSSSDRLSLACGLHPHGVESQVDWEWWEERCAAPEVRAVGEVGLDYHPAPWNTAPPERQRSVFQGFLDLARRLGKPAVVHTREAWADMLPMVEAHPGGGILHAFSAGVEEAARAWAAGWTIGLGGPVTYPRNQTLREVAARAPAGGLVLETDSPYLPPQGHRGERNEPSHLVHVAAAVAEARGESVATVAEATTAQARRLLGLG
jgi:TatD DNase family protein